MNNFPNSDKKMGLGIYLPKSKGLKYLPQLMVQKMNRVQDRKLPTSPSRLII